MLVNFYLFLLFILGKCNDDFAKILKNLNRAESDTFTIDLVLQKTPK